MKTPVALALALSLAWAMPSLAETGPAMIPIADTQRGTMVAVQGTVDRINDTDEFTLTDATGSIRVYVGPNWVPADIGEAVTVRGFVDDDFGRKEIYARELVRADGSTVTFDQRYE